MKNNEKGVGWAAVNPCKQIIQIILLIQSIRYCLQSLQPLL